MSPFNIPPLPHNIHTSTHSHTSHTYTHPHNPHPHNIPTHPHTTHTPTQHPHPPPHNTHTEQKREKSSPFDRSVLSSQYLLSLLRILGSTIIQLVSPCTIYGQPRYIATNFSPPLLLLSPHLSSFFPLASPSRSQPFLPFSLSSTPSSTPLPCHAHMQFNIPGTALHR